MRTFTWRWPWLRRPRRPARILLIDDFVPNITIGAGVPRMIELLRALRASGAEVTLLPRAMRILSPSYAKELTPHGATIIDGEVDLGSFLAARGGEFDGIIVSRPSNMAQLCEALQASPNLIGDATLIYDAEALFSERRILRRKLTGKLVKSAKADRQIAAELDLANGADIVIAVSERVASAFRRAGHSDVRVLGHAIVPQPTPQAFELRQDFLCVGQALADLSPNADAVVWFVDQVLPQVRRQLDRDITLKFAGAVGSPAMQARVGQGLVLLGSIPDLSDVYGAARVFVAATRYASGLPLKVFEAAARGVPCVVTPLLAEQLGWTRDQEVLVAATPEEFANACAALYSHKALWTRIRTEALVRVAKECDPRSFDLVVAGLVRSIVKRKKG